VGPWRQGRRYNLEEDELPSELSICSIYIYIHGYVGHQRISCFCTHTHRTHTTCTCILGLNEETMSAICDVVAKIHPLPLPLSLSHSLPYSLSNTSLPFAKFVVLRSGFAQRIYAAYFRDTVMLYPSPLPPISLLFSTPLTCSWRFRFNFNSVSLQWGGWGGFGLAS